MHTGEASSRTLPASITERKRVVTPPIAKFSTMPKSFPFIFIQNTQNNQKKKPK